MRSRNALKNIVTSLLLQFIVILCGFIVPRLIISTYGSATNGLINSITQFLAYITLLESGFGPVIKSILYKPIIKKEKKEITKILKATEKSFRRIALAFVGYIGVLCFIFPSIVGGEFDTWYTISLLIVIAVGTFGEYFFGMTYSLYLQAEQKTYITSYFQIVTTILNTIVVVILIRIGCSIQVVKLISALILIIRPIALNWYVKKRYRISLAKVDKNYKIKQKWDGLAQHIAAVIHSNTDVTVLTLFATFQEVSVYAVYGLVVKGLKNIIQAFNSGIDAAFGDMMARGEHELMNKRFAVYEYFFHTISTIIFICAMVLIVPFIAIYAGGIMDADYVRPVFGVLIVISELVWAVRLPYSSTTLAAGHFKQTRKGAFVEAGLNIILSVTLVFNFGVAGVAVGTIAAMLIRTVEFMYHCSRYILKRGILRSFSWLFVIGAECIVALGIVHVIGVGEINSYMDWFKTALIVFIITGILVFSVNTLIYHEDAKELLRMIKRVRKKENK